MLVAIPPFRGRERGSQLQRVGGTQWMHPKKSRRGFPNFVAWVDLVPAS